jgi:hypothetical protein
VDKTEVQAASALLAAAVQAAAKAAELQAQGLGLLDKDTPEDWRTAVLLTVAVAAQAKRAKMHLHLLLLEKAGTALHLLSPARLSLVQAAVAVEVLLVLLAQAAQAAVAQVHQASIFLQTER